MTVNLTVVKKYKSYIFLLVLCEAVLWAVMHVMVHVSHFFSPNISDIHLLHYVLLLALGDGFYSFITQTYYQRKVWHPSQLVFFFFLKLLKESDVVVMVYSRVKMTRERRMLGRRRQVFMLSFYCKIVPSCQEQRIINLSKKNIAKVCRETAHCDFDSHRALQFIPRLILCAVNSCLYGLPHSSFRRFAATVSWFVATRLLCQGDQILSSF